MGVRLIAHLDCDGACGAHTSGYLDPQAKDADGTPSTAAVASQGWKTVKRPDGSLLIFCPTCRQPIDAEEALRAKAASDTKRLAAVKPSNVAAVLKDLGA